MNESPSAEAAVLRHVRTETPIGVMDFAIRMDGHHERPLRITQVPSVDALRVDLAGQTIALIDRNHFFVWLRTQDRLPFAMENVTWSWVGLHLRVNLAGMDCVFPDESITTLRLLAGR